MPCSPFIMLKTLHERNSSTCCKISVDTSSLHRVSTLADQANRRLLRDPLEHPSQEALTQDMAVHLRHRLRSGHGLPGTHAELFRYSRDAFLLGLVRMRHVPWLFLSFGDVVQARGSPETFHILFLLDVPSGCIWWPIGFCHWKE